MDYLTNSKRYANRAEKLDKLARAIPSLRKVLGKAASKDRERATNSLCKGMGW